MLIPPGLDGGRTAVRITDLPGETGLVEVGTALAAGIAFRARMGGGVEVRPFHKG